MMRCRKSHFLVSFLLLLVALPCLVGAFHEDKTKTKKFDHDKRRMIPSRGGMKPNNNKYYKKTKMSQQVAYVWRPKGNAPSSPKETRKRWKRHWRAPPRMRDYRKNKSSKKGKSSHSKASIFKMGKGSKGRSRWHNLRKDRPKTNVTDTATTGSPTASPIIGQPAVETQVKTTLPPASSVMASQRPTSVPTRVPITSSPTQLPTHARTTMPTHLPTTIPTTAVPSRNMDAILANVTVTNDRNVTNTPSRVRTRIPTQTPTGIPTRTPTAFPTATLTTTPTSFPTKSPTVSSSLKNWVERVNLAQVAVDDEYFGTPLHLSADGTILTLGAFTNSEDQTNGGRIVRLNLTTTNHDNVVDIHGPEPNDFLGFEFHATHDSKIVVAFGSAAGTLYVLEYNNDTTHGHYTPVSWFDVPVARQSADFVLSGNGQWLVVVGEDYDQETGITDNLLLLYKYNANRRAFETSGDEVLFGQTETTDWAYFDIATSQEGDYVAVSLVGRDEFTGAVRAYQRSGTQGTLIPMGDILISNEQDDKYGHNVEIVVTPAGDVIMGFSVLEADAVHVYKYNDGADQWEALGGSPIQGPDSSGSEFGFDFVFASSGTRLVVGAPASDDYSGAVYIYDLVQDEWVQQGMRLTGNSDSSFGESVSLDESGTILAIGAPADCQGVFSNICGGSAHVFQQEPDNHKDTMTTGKS